MKKTKKFDKEKTFFFSDKPCLLNNAVGERKFISDNRITHKQSKDEKSLEFIGNHPEMCVL